MHRVYEIFEVWPDGSTVKRAVVSGLEFAKVMLDALAKRTSHECMAADAETHQVVAQRNVPRAKGRAAKRIFQIAYDEGIGFRRAQLLRELGYGVISVLGTIQFTGMVFCQAADTRSHIAVSIHPIPLRDALGTIRVRAYRIVCPKTKRQTRPDSKWGQSTRAQLGD